MVMVIDQNYHHRHRDWDKHILMLEVGGPSSLQNILGFLSLSDEQYQLSVMTKHLTIWE